MIMPRKIQGKST